MRRAVRRIGPDSDVQRLLARRTVTVAGLLLAVFGLILIRAHDLQIIRGPDLAERARTKRLSPDDVQGGTFTITNPGVFGSLMGAPIISQPQVAILGVGVIKKRPVVIDDAIAIRPIMYLSLSFDHRLVDGAVAAQFLAHVVDHLEKP